MTEQEIAVLSEVDAAAAERQEANALDNKALVTFDAIAERCKVRRDWKGYREAKLSFEKILDSYIARNQIPLNFGD